jgi:transposase
MQWFETIGSKKLFKILHLPNNNIKCKSSNYKNFTIDRYIAKNNNVKCKNINIQPNDTIKTFRHKLEINKEQKDIILKWMESCRKVYNHCVDLYNNKKIKNFNYMKLKLQIFNDIYGKNKKDCPYDILTDEVRIFCSNIKSSITNVKNNNINHFEMKYRSFIKGQSILISKRSIKHNGVFVSKLGNIKNFDKIDINKVKCDCRLVYDKIFDNFYLYVPEHITAMKKQRKWGNVVALDPGEKIFMTFFSLKDYGKIGENIRNIILKIEMKIRKYQRILSRRVNNNNKKLKNKKAIKRKINKLYRNIGNIVKELHNQTALFLCKRYKQILLPEFRTKQMVTDKIKEKRRIEIEKIKKEGKEKIREYTRKVRLNKRVKFVMNMLKYYKFKQQLQTKSLEYGCDLKIVTEEYTTQCCGKCGELSKKYNGRIKQCNNCKYEINRDINGARNILIKNSDIWKK